MTSILYRKYYGSDLTTRQENDFYATPRDATVALCEHVRFRGMIWEPACGTGAIVQVLREYYHSRYLTFSDLLDYHYSDQQVCDFLTTDRQVANIVTNAPYSMSPQFIYQAVKCATQKVAMIFRLDFLQSKARKMMFQETGLTDIYVMSWRVKFVIRGKPRGMVSYAWYVWDKTHPLKEGDPYRLWIL